MQLLSQEICLVCTATDHRSVAGGGVSLPVPSVSLGGRVARILQHQKARSVAFGMQMFPQMFLQRRHGRACTAQSQSDGQCL